MQTENTKNSFIHYLEVMMNEQKMDFWGTSQYLSEMIFCDSEDCIVIVSLLENTDSHIP